MKVYEIPVGKIGKIGKISGFGRCNQKVSPIVIDGNRQLVELIMKSEWSLGYVC